ncbi:hypothetical protein [Bacillus cytotoxicus]|uniref:hypothetical protein n=1 Tax=Bacillus cytotoxicus TaxID=580165 RepID=UPI0006614780|nr:hypothetical protein [Bacillus cytotoxicus]AWC34305.1 hypothetical protein CG482_019130 [Bacillus cytotoxicus]AWC38304.1 hypothetical protein CG481_018980 [Bacillus cytotoxicus]AWC62521.1 hypothetical protein CG474_018700 [Bacillus cytotoxicus]KMT51770.1 hypothetical protein TU51_02330 [Bacillus cytotoxicus]HDR7310475.1 hypothetical protein [Bacillus cytotoxicus]
MKTVLAIAGLIWVMSHSIPIFEGEQIRTALNKHFSEYRMIDRQYNVVKVRVKDCFHTVTVEGNTVVKDTKVCDSK